MACNGLRGEGKVAGLVHGDPLSTKRSPSSPAQAGTRRLDPTFAGVTPFRTAR
jgi:hypothetical protein